MNRHLSALALVFAFAAPGLHAEPLRVAHVVDLAPVQVRAPAPAPRVGHVVTLPTVYVRPQPDTSAGTLLAQARERVVTLGTVYVRPTAQQLAEHAAYQARRRAMAMVVRTAQDLSAAGAR